MRILKTLTEIVKLGQERALYIRWSRGPTLDREWAHSVDQVSGRVHNGLSVQRVRADDPWLLAKMLQEYQFLRRKDAKIYCWILAGSENGTDSDGAPTIDADTIKPIGRISDELIQLCSAYNNACWQWARVGYRSNHPSGIGAEVERLWQQII